MALFWKENWRGGRKRSWQEERRRIYFAKFKFE